MKKQNSTHYFLCWPVFYTMSDILLVFFFLILPTVIAICGNNLIPCWILNEQWQGCKGNVTQTLFDVWPLCSIHRNDLFYVRIKIMTTTFVLFKNGIYITNCKRAYLEKHLCPNLFIFRFVGSYQIMYTKRNKTIIVQQ